MGRVEWNLKEGDYFEPIKEVARVYGKSCNILLGERTALNILARCSGIATRYIVIYLRKKFIIYSI
jgi:nicotinate-nucleotide pyrophosphorylase (carboxylating)